VLLLAAVQLLVVAIVEVFVAARRFTLGIFLVTCHGAYPGALCYGGYLEISSDRAYRYESRGNM
jgi:hypothetical protein